MLREILERKTNILKVKFYCYSHNVAIHIGHIDLEIKNIKGIIDYKIIENDPYMYGNAKLEFYLEDGYSYKEVFKELQYAFYKCELSLLR